jgi:hypothetical protein
MKLIKTILINSAVAFFFLFFLHGTSIGNGQQGISYNVPTLGEGGDFNHKCQCGKLMFNIAVNVERSTAPPLLPNVCWQQCFLIVKLKIKYK